MRIILNNSLQPYFNLAAEEYILEHSCGDVFMLWRNSSSVIIGKNQNAWVEVNTDYTDVNGISVVRRLTGGGAVFHDVGNVNFTFITDAKDEEKLDFSRFTAPIIKALAELGIASKLDGRNDIVSEGFKISGNAQCVYRRSDGKKRLMHHGTLLYDADLVNLAGALRVNDAKLNSKGIRSVSSRVKNLRNIGGLDLDVVGFMEHLLAYVQREYGTVAEGFTSDEICGIDVLVKSKYSTWEWNFGASPECEETRIACFPWGSIQVDYTLKHGIITSCFICGDFFGEKDVSVLEDALIGCRFDKPDIAKVLEELSVGRVIFGASINDILALFGFENR